MKSSIQPRKQRKFNAVKPMHLRRAALHIHLSKELKAKLGTKKRALLANKGDKVKVIKGDFDGKEGRIARLEYSTGRVFVEGIVAKNAKGNEKLRPISPSSLVLLDGDFTDKDRKAIIAR